LQAYEEVRQAWASVFPHANFGAISLVLDFVHQPADQEDAPPVVGEEILPIGGGRKMCGIESVAGITYHNQDSPVLVARNRTLDLLLRVTLATSRKAISISNSFPAAYANCSTSRSTASTMGEIAFTSAERATSK
jgi:hypothetical protein